LHDWSGVGKFQWSRYLEYEVIDRSSLTDSQGRSTQTRIALSGEKQTYWGEGFTLSSVSADSAHAAMLNGVTVCPQLVGTNYVDVGIGVFGSVYVVTLASP
jgi:hypothetical protein